METGILTSPGPSMTVELISRSEPSVKFTRAHRVEALDPLASRAPHAPPIRAVLAAARHCRRPRHDDVLVPVGIAYAEASGVPGINGLYATIVPLLAYRCSAPAASSSSARFGARPR